MEEDTRRIILIYSAIHNTEGRASYNNFLSSTRRNFVPILLLHHHHFCPLFSVFVSLPFSIEKADDAAVNLRQELR
jgi:hypothetical protein